MTFGTWNFRVCVAGVLKILIYIYIYGKCENLNFLGTPLKDKCSSLCYDDTKFKKNSYLKKQRVTILSILHLLSILLRRLFNSNKTHFLDCIHTHTHIIILLYVTFSLMCLGSVWPVIRELQSMELQLPDHDSNKPETRDRKYNVQ